MSGRRLDQALVENGAFPSRARAQGAIRAGLVRVGGAVATRPAQLVPEDARIEVEGDVHDYVSRGALKLAAGLDAFGVDPAGLVCLDLGASTGGFTEVLLRRGAVRVYAVDVGHGQLHPRVAGDPRVVACERTHSRCLTRAVVPEPVGLIVCDVSFISLRKALPPALSLAAAEAALVALVKPQFEVGPERIGKGGLVKADAEGTVAVARDIAAWLEAQGWRIDGIIDSPITGGDGNREHLIGARRA